MNRFQPKPHQMAADIWNVQLPTNVLWGIYARQSTPGQLVKCTQSTEMQTDDLIKWLQDRNVKNNYVLFDADLGLSGTLRIDERPALRELIRRINAGEIKAVLVYQISRLFRDLTGIQYNTFADDCKQHSCILVTAYDGMIFSFNNPVHLKMFRFLAETAAEYLQQQIGLLHEARLRKARKGLYAAGSVPSGFIVDYDKDSPTFQKIIPYKAHQEIILERLYRRYYALDGNFTALCREIDSMPYVFPLFESWVDRRIVNQWKRRLRNGGYFLTRKGILSIMTNPANIGWWIVAGDIISKKNHDPLVPLEEQYLFWYAFDRLSPYSTDGQENGKRVIGLPKRYYRRATDPTGGILKDRIDSPEGKVHVHIKEGGLYYTITPEHTVYRKNTREIDAKLVDDAFEELFFEHLRETHDFDEYQQWVTNETTQHEALIATLTKQLKQFDASQEAILNEIIAIRAQIAETTEDEEEKKRLLKEAAPYIAKLREKFTSLEAPKKDVSDKLQQAQASEHYSALREYADFHTELAKLIPVWHLKPFSIRKEFVNLFVNRAVLKSVAPHWIELNIHWTHPQWDAEILYIPRPRGPRPDWTEEEKVGLRKYYPTASKETLLHMFPGKNWSALSKEAPRLGIKREVRDPSSYADYLSLEDVHFMQTHDIPLDATTPICSLSPCSENEEEGTSPIRETGPPL